MRYIIKGVYCLPDDGYYEEKANDGLTLFWLNRLKKLIKLGVPDIMLYSEIEQINNKIAYVVSMPLRANFHLHGRDAACRCAKEPCVNALTG